MRLLSYQPTTRSTPRPSAAPVGGAIAPAALPVAPQAAQAEAVGGVTAAALDLVARAKGWLSRMFGQATPPVAAAPAAGPVGGSGGIYAVLPGDTIFKIAQRTLGDGNRWQEILNANFDQFSNPNLIFPGMVLKVPGAAPVAPPLPALAPAPAPAPTPAPAPAPAPAPTVGSGPMVRKGTKGEPVKRLQERLAQLGFDPKGADGQFGPNTDAAVKAFQASQGLEADGVVGPKTWGKLGIKVEGTVEHTAPAAPGGPSSNELVDMGAGHPKAVRRFGKLIGAAIAPKFDAMVAAAAADGVSLRITSGYRSHAEQIVLWNLYQAGKGNIAARPGTSNHEKGDAIDFTNTPGAWAWLKKNSTRFGFKNFDPEPWHYSLNGG